MRHLFFIFCMFLLNSCTSINQVADRDGGDKSIYPYCYDIIGRSPKNDTVSEKLDKSICLGDEEERDSAATEARQRCETEYSSCRVETCKLTPSQRYPIPGDNAYIKGCTDY